MNIKTYISATTLIASLGGCGDAHTEPLNQEIAIATAVAGAKAFPRPWHISQWSFYDGFGCAADQYTGLPGFSGPGGEYNLKYDLNDVRDWNLEPAKSSGQLQLVDGKGRKLSFTVQLAGCERQRLGKCEWTWSWADPEWPSRLTFATEAMRQMALQQGGRNYPDAQSLAAMGMLDVSILSSPHHWSGNMAIFNTAQASYIVHGKGIVLLERKNGDLLGVVLMSCEEVKP